MISQVNNTAMAVAALSLLALALESMAFWDLPETIATGCAWAFVISVVALIFGGVVARGSR